MLSELVREHLAQCNLRQTSQVRVADYFGMSRRVMGTALEREGTGWNELLDAERRRRYEEYVNLTGHKDVPRKMVAYICGLGDDSAGSKALKKWGLR